MSGVKKMYVGCVKGSQGEKMHEQWVERSLGQELHKQYVEGSLGKKMHVEAEGTLGQEMHVRVEGTLTQEMHVGVEGNPAYWQPDGVQHADHGYGWHELSSCLVVQYLLVLLDLPHRCLPKGVGQLYGEGVPLP